MCVLSFWSTYEDMMHVGCRAKAEAARKAKAAAAKGKNLALLSFGDQVGYTCLCRSMSFMPSLSCAFL